MNNSIYRGLAIGAIGFLVCLLGCLVAHVFYPLGFLMVVVGAIAIFAGFFIHLGIYFGRAGRRKI